MSAASNDAVSLVKGLHPLDERYIGAYAWRGESAAAVQEASPLRCPLCLGVLVSTHRQRRGYGYFRHESDADAARCPLATTSYQPEGLVVKGPQESPVAHTHRARFLLNWKRHYRLARSMVSSLTVKRFTELIEYADVLNLWSYPLLELRDLPYVLLVMAGFMAVRGEGEDKTWVRYWFDGSVRDAGDLWRADAGVAQLFRVEYRDSLRTPFPTSAEILHWAPTVRIERLQDLTGPGVTRADVKAFARFVERNASVRRAPREDGNG